MVCEEALSSNSLPGPHVSKVSGQLGSGEEERKETGVTYHSDDDDDDDDDDDGDGDDEKDLEADNRHVCLGNALAFSRFSCSVLLVLSWNTNENPSTDKLSRAIN